MHFCHARHYSTLRNVHYRKRGEEKEKRVLRDIVNRLTDGHVIVWCPRFESHMRPHFFYHFSYFQLRQATSSAGLWFLCILSCILLFFLLLIRCKISLAAFIYINESAFNVRRGQSPAPLSVVVGGVECCGSLDDCVSRSGAVVLGGLMLVYERLSFLVPGG